MKIKTHKLERKLPGPGTKWLAVELTKRIEREHAYGATEDEARAKVLYAIQAREDKRIYGGRP